MSGFSDRLRDMAKRAVRVAEWQRTALAHASQPPPIYPRASGDVPSGLRVHLGAGEINLQGWVNVDARAFAHVHSHVEVLTLPEFAEGSLAALYLCHVLEHVSFEEARTLLSTWFGKLKPGGVLILSVPDFDALVRIYLDSGRNLDAIKFPLMGGQGYEYNFHRSVYTSDALKRSLEAAGFTGVSPWTTADLFGQEIGDWSSRLVPDGKGGKMSISLNLRGTKPGAAEHR